MNVLIEGSTEFLKMRELTTVSLMISRRMIIGQIDSSSLSTENNLWLLEYFTLSYAPLFVVVRHLVKTVLSYQSELLWISNILIFFIPHLNHFYQFEWLFVTEFAKVINKVQQISVSIYDDSRSYLLNYTQLCPLHQQRLLRCKSFLYHLEQKHTWKVFLYFCKNCSAMVWVILFNLRFGRTSDMLYQYLCECDYCFS